MTQIQQYIVIIITLYNVMSIKKAEKTEQVYIYSLLYFCYLSFLVSFICSCGSELPSGIISLLKYNFDLTHLFCAVIIRYISIYYRPNIPVIYILFYTTAF